MFHMELGTIMHNTMYGTYKVCSWEGRVITRALNEGIPVLLGITRWLRARSQDNAHIMYRYLFCIDFENLQY